MFGSVGDMMSLLGSLGKISKEYKDVTEELKSQRIEATAGEGMVKVIANGTGEVVDIEISADLVAGGDVEKLQDLVKTAVGSALDQARSLAQEQMGKIMEGLPLGPLKSLLGKQE